MKLATEIMQEFNSSEGIPYKCHVPEDFQELMKNEIDSEKYIGLFAYNIKDPRLKDLFLLAVKNSRRAILMNSLFPGPWNSIQMYFIPILYKFIQYSVIYRFSPSFINDDLETTRGLLNLVKVENSEESISPTIHLDIKPVKFIAFLQEIVLSYDITEEMFLNSLLSFSTMEEFIENTAIEITSSFDQKIINELLSAAGSNEQTHQKTFCAIVPESYKFGDHNYYQNLLTPLNELSSQIFVDTAFSPADTVVMNKEILDKYFKRIPDMTLVDESDLYSIYKNKFTFFGTKNIPKDKILVIQSGLKDLLRSCIINYSNTPLLLTPLPITSSDKIEKYFVMQKGEFKIINKLGLALINLSGV